MFWSYWLLISWCLNTVNPLPQILFRLDLFHSSMLGIVTVSIVHAEPIIKTTAEPLKANIISWPALSQRNSLCSPEPLPSGYTDLTGTVWLSMVSTKGVGWRVEDGLQWFPGKAPQGCVPLFTQRAQFRSELDKPHFQTAGQTSLGVSMRVPSGLRNTEILHLAGLCPAPARDDHSNPQVWWSLPRSRHPNPSPRSPALFSNMLPEDATMCSIHSTKAIGDPLFLARTLLTEVGIMSQCWRLCRLGP